MAYEITFFCNLCHNKIPESAMAAPFMLIDGKFKKVYLPGVVNASCPCCCANCAKKISEAHRDWERDDD